MVVAVPASGDDSSGATSLYVVQLVQAPVATYGGGVAGYAATKPGKGKKLDAGSSAAQSYAGYLNAKHDGALEKVGGGDKVYDYTAVFNGFAAQLTAEQASKLELLKDVAVVEKAENVPVDATATPAPRRVPPPERQRRAVGQARRSQQGRPGQRRRRGCRLRRRRRRLLAREPAFSDRKVDGSNGNNYPHKVTGFSGICQAGEAFPASTCNGKVIAARYYVAGMGAANIPDYESCRRVTTAATARTPPRPPRATTASRQRATRPASAPSAASRLARASPSTRPAGCSPARPAARATAPTRRRPSTRLRSDGVDVINYSICGTSTAFTNSVEVSFLNAAAAGVFVTASAGNSGPTVSTVAHPSPWIMTTAAGTTTVTVQAR